MYRKIILICILAFSLMNAQGQSAKDVEKLAKAFLTAQSKGSAKSLKPYMLNRANFDKYFKDEIIKMMGNEMEISAIYPEIDAMTKQYDDIPSILKNGTHSGKLTYSHFDMKQSDEAFIATLKQATISIIYKDGKGDFYTLILGETFITKDGMIIKPDPKWFNGDILKGCNCLIGFEYVDDSMVGAFDGECSFLNDYNVLDEVARACGIWWNYGDYDNDGLDYYAEIDICLCQDHFKNYQRELEDAFAIADVFERQDRMIEINEQYSYLLWECKEKERILRDEDGFESMEAIIESCLKD